MSVYDEIREEIMKMKIDKKAKRGTKLYKPLLILSMLDYYDDLGDETHAFNNPTHVNKLVDFFTIYLENEIIKNETFRNASNHFSVKNITRVIREQPLFFITNIEGKKSNFFFNDLDPKITNANRPRRLENMAKYFEIKVPDDIDLDRLANHIRSSCLERIFNETGIIIGDSIVHVIRQEKETNSYYRLGQDQFRKKLKEKYNNKCAFCDFGVEHTLIASHAKPWKACENTIEKLSEDNGFLLCANHDKMFDRGYITINIYNKTFVFSNALSVKELEECKNTLPSNQFSYEISDDMKKFLMYHSEKVFKEFRE